MANMNQVITVALCRAEIKKAILEYDHYTPFQTLQHL